jgi:hypothetical protein
MAISILTTLVPALLPAVSDMVSGLVSKLVGRNASLPKNVDDAIKLMEAETHRLQVLAELDKPQGEVSKWVNDLRGSARYISVYVILLVWALASFGVITAVTETAYLLVCDLASSAFFYLFGDRVYVNIKQGTKAKK